MDSININALRVFELVYRTGNMTKAAEILHITQSGVSQHISQLEFSLEVELFSRAKKRLIPTKEAEVLYEQCSKQFQNLERTLSAISNKERELTGKVTIGVPVEFGNNLVLPKLAQLKKEMPGINYKIYYGFASEMNDQILNGKVDFAFVDSFKMDPIIKTEKVYEESLNLCCHKNYYKNTDRSSYGKKYFESLDYVAYTKNAPVINGWFQTHQYKKMDLEIATESMDVQGVATLIMNEVGVGVLPAHQMNKMDPQGKLFHSFNKKDYLNTISMAYLPARANNALIDYVIQVLKDRI